MTRFLATSSLRPLAALVFSMAGFSAAQAQFDLKTVLDNECQKVKNKEPYHLDLSTAFSDAGHQAWEFGSGQVDELITPDQLDQPIKPGEYAVPVIGYALMFGVPQPGPGQPCRLGRLEGPLASEITTLCSRGTLKSAAPDLLNGLIWRIEAGIPSKGLPSDGMTAVHELAPEIETALNHDYLSSVRDVDKPLHLFSWSTQRLIEDLDSLGPNGHAIADLYRVRGVLQNKRLKDYDLPGATLALFNANAQLALPKFDPQTDSPWAQVERGVFIRIDLRDGVWNKNYLEIHIAHGADSTLTLASLLGLASPDTSTAGPTPTAAAIVAYPLGSDNPPTPLLLIPKFDFPK